MDWTVRTHYIENTYRIGSRMLERERELEREQGAREMGWEEAGAGGILAPER